MPRRVLVDWLFCLQLTRASTPTLIGLRYASADIMVFSRAQSASRDGHVLLVKLVTPIVRFVIISSSSSAHRPRATRATRFLIAGLLPPFWGTGGVSDPRSLSWPDPLAGLSARPYANKGSTLVQTKAKGGLTAPWSALHAPS